MNARGHEKLRKLAKDMRSEGVAAHLRGRRFEAMGLFRRARALDEILDETFGTGPCERCGSGDIPARVCDGCIADMRPAGFDSDEQRFLESLDDLDAARGFLRLCARPESEHTGDDVADAKRFFFAQFETNGSAVSL